MTSSHSVLVIDLGTHKCTAVAMTERGTVTAQAVSERYPTYRDAPGRAEQDPEDWWQAALYCIRAVVSRISADSIAGIVTVGHGPSHLPVDADLNPLGRSLIWQDTRARSEAAWIAENTSTEDRFAWLGLHLPIAPGMGPAKLLWLRDHEPDIYRSAAAIIQPKDFVNLRLTGVLATDRYGMKDIVHAHTGEFTGEYARALGLRRDIVPEIHLPWSIIGKTTASQRRDTGLPAGIPVGCGTIDAFSGLIGSGGTEDGEICDVSGTSEIVGLLRNAPAAPFEGFLCYPLIFGYSVAFGVTRAAGDSIDWFIRKVAGANDSGVWIRAFEERQMEASPANAGGPVLFWPYLDGERSPYWNADLRGMFMGLDMDSGADVMARAVFEGVAMSVRHNIDLLRARTGTAARRMWVGGGTARSRFFNQIKADVTGLEVVVPLEYNSTARGAAAMLHAGLGMQPDVLAAANALVGDVERICPREEWRERYERLLPIYVEMGERLSDIHSRLAVIRG